MIGWLFQSLPSIIFEPFFYAGLAGLILLAADRNRRFMDGKTRVLLLAAFAGMFLWRFVAARDSSRYSSLLIPLFLLFSTLFISRLLDWIPSRFRKLAAILIFGVIFAVCVGKIVRQYDPVRTRLFRSIAGCVQREPGRTSLVCDGHDGRRLAWYAGLPEFFEIPRQGRTPEDCQLALFPLRNRERVFYVVWQDPRSSSPVTAEALQLPESDWKLCGEFIKDRHKKYVLRVYRFQPEPHWRKIEGPVPKKEDARAAFRDDFESATPVEATAEPHLILPPGWGINGIPKPDVRIFPETADPISGAGSLTVRASLVEFLPKKYFPAKGDYILRFLVRGSKGCSLLARVFVSPPQGGNKAIDFDKFFFEDGDLRECRIPISFQNVPDRSRFRIAFRSYDGTVTLDNLQLIPVTQHSERWQKETPPAKVR